MLTTRLGHDIQEIAGLEARTALLEPDLVFTEGELQRIRLSDRPQQKLAGYFSAKEAFFKAMPVSPYWRWSDLELCQHAGGRPYFAFHGALCELMQVQGLSAEVSISHSGAYASSVVLLTARELGHV